MVAEPSIHEGDPVRSATPSVRAALYLVVPRNAEKAQELLAKLDGFRRSMGYALAVRYLEPIDECARRRRLKLLLARARTGAFDVVCVRRLDDLASTRPRVVRVVRELAALGVRVESAGGLALDGSAPLARWIANDAERHRRRIKRALEAKRARGERVGAVPYGYRLAGDGEHLEPDEGEQFVIAEARRLREDGGTLRGIASTLSEWGYKSRTGTAFTHKQISRILAGGRVGARLRDDDPGLTPRTT